MIVETADRVATSQFKAPTIVCNVDHRFLVGESFAESGIKPRAILLEPVARNTAAAIITATYSVYREDPDALILVMPSDHSIKNRDALYKAIDRAQSTAASGRIVTFGIKASRPITGYGYIEQGEAIDEDGHVMSVTQFHEKPDYQTAIEYLKKGSYSWNSGMFLFQAATLLEIIKELDPVFTDNAINAVNHSVTDLDFIRFDENSFSALPSQSFDITVMEKTHQAAVIPVDMDWNDVGSWGSLWEASEKDTDGNVSLGETVMIDCSRSLAWNDDTGIATMIGVEDLLVVVNDGAVLVTTRDQAEKVRGLVDHLKLDGKENHLITRTIHRPWGSYRNLDLGEGYLVKRIVVKSGARLSLQYHNHRAEHWVVVSGSARVTNDKKIFDLGANESTYLPTGSIHRLENTGPTALILIEVQTGNLLSEDDIVRLDDIYSRKTN